MRRHGLRDDQWDRTEALLPGRKGAVGMIAADNRLFVEVVLYRYRAGIPWRDLPERCGSPNVGNPVESMSHDLSSETLRSGIKNRAGRPWLGAGHDGRRWAGGYVVIS